MRMSTLLKSQRRSLLKKVKCPTEKILETFVSILEIAEKVDCDAIYITISKNGETLTKRLFTRKEK